jgi:hypothetical protein
MEGGWVAAVSVMAVAAASVFARAVWCIFLRPRAEERGVGDRDGDLCCTSSNVLV